MIQRKITEKKVGDDRENYRTYGEVRRYFSQAEHTRGIRPGLSRMRRLMELLGNPEKRVRGIIHVAGTNGKGSMLAFLDEILRRSGYRVVKYTSPAVFSYLERYTLDGQPVSEEQFAAAAEHVIAAAERMAGEEGDPPTAFEMETAAAYRIAAESECDFFLVETGMGGALDATNIAERVTLSVIGSVSMDHMAFLGDTLEKIAIQKAGIIKDGCPVVVSASNFSRKTGGAGRFLPLSGAVYGKMSVESGTRDMESGEMSVESEAQNMEPEELSGNVAGIIEKIAAGHRAPFYRGDDRVPYRLSLFGTCQQENAGTVSTAIRVLRKIGYEIPESCVRDGFENTVWPGRFEMVRTAPLCVLDGAHNADAAARLAGTLREPQFAGKRLFLVLGVFKDKEYDRVAQALAPLAEEVYVFTLVSPRGLSADTLAACVKCYTERPVHKCADVVEAVQSAYCAAVKSGETGSGAAGAGMVLCCGSLSYLEEAKKLLKSAGVEQPAIRA